MMVVWWWWFWFWDDGDDYKMIRFDVIFDGGDGGVMVGVMMILDFEMMMVLWDDDDDFDFRWF